MTWPSDTITGQIVIFFTVVIGHLVSLWKQARDRRWDMEDRQLARGALNQKLSQAQEQIEENTQLTKVTLEHASGLKDGLLEELLKRYDEMRLPIPSQQQKEGKPPPPPPPKPGDHA